MTSSCVKPFRQNRNRDRHALWPLAEIHMRLSPARNRFFDDQNVVMPGGAAEQMLRALPHEIPAQMGKTYQQRLSELVSKGER